MESNKSFKNERTLQNDPQYFGAYLNNARHNILLIVNELANKFGYKPIDDDGLITSSFLVNKITKKPNQIYNSLIRFMPIAKLFDNEKLPKSIRESNDEAKAIGRNFDKMAKSLRSCFKELNEFRNDYTHCYSTETGFDKKLVVDEDFRSLITYAFKVGIEYTKSRFENVFKEEDYIHLDKFKLFEENGNIHQNGLVFLICSFLDRETAFQFINSIKYLKDTREAKFKVTREVITSYSLKLPQEKLLSDDPVQSLALDILNDLNKCPKTLYNVLTNDGKKSFAIELSEEAIQKIDDNSVPDDIEEEDVSDYIQSLSKRVRSSDRFTYFSLRYLEDSNAFKKIKFHINLGKYQLNSYKKKIGNEEMDRQIIESAKAFGKLADFGDLETAEKAINNKQIEEAYFEQWAPHYHVSNNKIGIYVDESSRIKWPILRSRKIDERENRNLLQPLPTAFISTHELPKIILLELFKPGKVEELILKFIDSNNNMIFNDEFIKMIKDKLAFDSPFKKYADTKNRTAYYPDFLDQLKLRKEKLNTFLKEYDLNDKQIPTRILNHWLNISNIEDKIRISEYIKSINQDCKSRLKAIDKMKAPKIGEMATYLAKDIIRLVISKEVKQNITSFYYDAMQECLALYADPEKKKRLLQLLKEMKLTDTTIGHPFLINLDFEKFKYTQEIYKSYLQEKGKKEVKTWNNKLQKEVIRDESWLRKTFYNLEYNEKAKKYLTVVSIPTEVNKIKLLPYTIIDLLKKDSNFDEWNSNIMNGKSPTDKRRAIDLPTNLFEKEIVSVFSEEDQSDKKYQELFIEKDGKENLQDFYFFEREYMIYEERVNFLPNSKMKFIEYYQPILEKVVKNKKTERRLAQKQSSRLPEINEKDIEKVFAKSIADTERDIRLQQERDRIMAIVADRLISAKESIDISLKEMNKVLNSPIKLSQKVGDKIIYDTRKRKDFALFRRLLSDRRIPNLLHYYDEEQISYQVLKAELLNYHKYKDLIFDKIFEFENLLINKDEIGIKSLFIEKESGIIKSGNIQHFAFVDWLKNNFYIDEAKYNHMIEIRNKFSHNQYPSISVLSLKMSKGKSVAEQIYNYYMDCLETVYTKLS